ncbi:MAG TPA: VOC family protein, partial [Novosphingobium sp.]|nr:VOC family protein [Novosphingobium sp.]
MSKSNEPATAALADIYHHGLLVADLAATMAALGPALGVEWAPVRSFSPMPMWLADGTEAVAHLKVAYSRQGPIHLELIEARPGDAYGALRAENQAHLGVWVEDLAGEAEALLA